MPAPPATTTSGFPGAIRLFSFIGINVYLHWTWVLVGAIMVQSPFGEFSSQLWDVAAYLTLFVIVLLHEFGHALACRSVGGRADRILLWPLGGIAYVSPPRRPGAVLWSIAAGPLVNVALVPVTLGLLFNADVMFPEARDLREFLRVVAFINIGLLIFNMLPIYPLDGGQILQSILWFFIGPAQSLTVAATIGLVGAGAVLLLALSRGDFWLIFLALFAGSRSWLGIQQAKSMAQALSLPRHGAFRCPACAEPPPAGAFWRCSCGNLFDPFAAGGQCPGCRSAHGVAGCPFCGAVSPYAGWMGRVSPQDFTGAP